MREPDHNPISGAMPRVAVAHDTRKVMHMALTKHIPFPVAADVAAVLSILQVCDELPGGRKRF